MSLCDLCFTFYKKRSWKEKLLGQVISVQFIIMEDDKKSISISMYQRSEDPILAHRFTPCTQMMNSSFLTRCSLSLFSPASIRTFKIVCFRFIHESATWGAHCVQTTLFILDWLPTTGRNEADSLHGNLSLTSLSLLFPVSQQPQPILSRAFFCFWGWTLFQTASREATWDKEKNFDQEKRKLHETSNPMEFSIQMQLMCLEPSAPLGF